ncbi:MAG: MCE family protein, partial [Bacteroidetes bacterium]|nr:MCE family protein [Candidatus Cryptobacteroides excrementavium]
MKPSKELKIGIFVTVVLILSFFIINFLREKDIFNRQMELSATFPDVCGLTESAPVYIKGYKAGAVSDIAYDNVSGMFTVTCSFDKGFALPSDSKMVIYSVDIMGGKGIELVPGASAEPLEDGDMVEGVVRSDLLASLGNGLIPLV